ncbi:kinesin-like protein KIN-4C [Salvia miltiorrhiza]|uniref:kinesin-like protein KIN-4C n=1 Tax=Salvia miltiorrhiza TaxID=226208 RepID=UPI0025AB85DB|nr:kinesin-like protein KIN-4C [Salvia miltiorrhiza]
MENSESSSQSVRVAVNVRPLVTAELLASCTDCITVYPAQKQVQIGSHSFTFDYVYGSKGSPSSTIFDECVAPLVDALFHGYNGTVLAYGQTGSGKTYTMGTNYNGEEHGDAILPKVMDTIFSKVETLKESTEFLIRVSFIEVFKEDVFDLLDPKTTGPARVPIQIRERVSGGITLAGVTESEVRTKEEMASYLLQGSLTRATGSTKMNSQSSRSHAIFTISMEQRRRTNALAEDDVGDDVLIAKLHLVDLAGSERAKRTGADGSRLLEGIHINKGLLALGNVISALGDDKKRKEGGHVPYRDSKLTRILQDSLGGNCKTIMIACVSPADTNAEETLNTLKYANRARNIQNKAIINRDPVSDEMQRMRSQIEQLQSELLYFRGDSSAPTEELKILKHKVSLLEASKSELQEALQECRISYEHLKQRAIDAQVEKDRLVMLVESIRNGNPLDEINDKSDKDFDLVKSYITRIQELESELVRIRSSNHLRHGNSDGFLYSEDDGTHSRNLFMDADIRTEETDVVVEDVEKELEHSSIQEQLDRELQELDKRLEQKEAEMKRFASGDTSVLKQHYEKKVHELENEKWTLQKEIDELRHNLANISSNSDDSAQKLKEEYLQKLNVLEKQVAELKKKQDAQTQLLRQKQKSDEAAKRLHDEIQRIKTQKVQLQHKIKQESEQFRQWKACREKEVLQLKKEGRRNEYEMHKLLALNQRQKLVLQRKTEEAAMATKRLKELLDSRKASSRETSGAGSNRGPGIPALVQTIEHELEVTIGVHEVRSEYERQMKERARMAEELARLKEEALIEKQQNFSEFPQVMSPGARNSRIFALENMLATSSSTLVSMASQLSEAEERERAFSGRGRWNQVRSLAEAKNVMNFLFNLASSSRCQLRDREVDCREKDSEIRDLKEKVVNLVRQLELTKTEFSRRENLMMLALERQSNGKIGSENTTSNSDKHVYDLRPKGSRNSTILSSGIYDLELLEDMDTSDDEQSNLENDEDGDWGKTRERKRRTSRKRNSKMEHFDQSLSMRYTEGVCCSCSKSSSCKTSRCECRAASGICSSSCSCEATRCSNREASMKNMLQLSDNMSVCDEAETSHDLAAHGAMLLETALSEKPANQNTDGAARKPLSDIGNNIGLSSIPKPNLRKKWRKSAIQLVPATPPIAQPQNSEAPGQPPIAQPQNSEAPGQSKANRENDIPLKLPRAMRSTLTNNNQLKQRNTEQPSELVDGDIYTSSLGSPRQQAKTRNGKENKGL